MAKKTSNKFLQRLDAIVKGKTSFQTIMADGIVEESEISAQAERVNQLITQLEQRLSPEDFNLAVEVIAELSVLNLITQYNMLKK